MLEVYTLFVNSVTQYPYFACLAVTEQCSTAAIQGHLG